MATLRVATVLFVLTLMATASSATPTLTTTLPLQHTRLYAAEFVAPNSGMTPPRAIQYAAPGYTPEALANGVEGVVTVLAAFDIDGNFKVIRVEKGLGYGLDEKALEALVQWRFAPAFRSGRRVSVIANIDVAFELPPVRLKLRILDKLHELVLKMEELRAAPR